MLSLSNPIFVHAPPWWYEETHGPVSLPSNPLANTLAKANFLLSAYWVIIRQYMYFKRLDRLNIVGTMAPPCWQIIPDENRWCRGESTRKACVAQRVRPWHSVSFTSGHWDVRTWSEWCGEVWLCNSYNWPSSLRSNCKFNSLAARVDNDYIRRYEKVWLLHPAYPLST